MIDVVAVELTRVDCGKCGGVYAITERHHDWCRGNSKSWTCPYCATSWGFNHNGSPLERAQRAEREGRRAAAFKGQVTKIKNRVGNGVCPCCTRHFDNLHQHMQDQHPDWAPDAEPDGFEIRQRGRGPWFDVLDADGKVVQPKVRGRKNALAVCAELAR